MRIDFFAVKQTTVKYRTSTLLIENINILIHCRIFDKIQVLTEHKQNGDLKKFLRRLSIKPKLSRSAGL